MTNTPPGSPAGVQSNLPAPVVVPEEPTENSLDDFIYWQTNELIPRYVFAGFANADLASKDFVEEIRKIKPEENPGFQFFVAGRHTENYEENKVKKTRIVPGWYSVITNKVTSSVTLVSDAIAQAIGLSKVEAGTVEFLLPPIPYAMRDEIDMFLRAVDEKYHTEGIVLLTYDDAIGGAEGWNYLVPIQKNTGGHCDYEPGSIADQLPETASVVGSIHSHPGMPAYASGTDHKDQKGFDGIHITYGWSARTGNSTEFYAELEVQGTSWVMDIDDVFGAPEIKVEVPEHVTKAVEERVQKKVQGQTNGTSTWNQGGNSNHYKPGGPKSYSSSTASSKPTKYPTGKDAPSLETNFVIGRVEVSKNSNDVENHNCPFCGSGLLPLETSSKYRCTECVGYLIMPDQTITELVAARSASQIISEYDPNCNPAKPVYIWNPNEEIQFVQVYEPSQDNAGK